MLTYFQPFVNRKIKKIKNFLFYIAIFVFLVYNIGNSFYIKYSDQNSGICILQEIFSLGQLGQMPAATMLPY